MLVDNGIYQKLLAKKKKGQKQLAVLLDPDKIDLYQVNALIQLSLEAEVDYFFIGGSLLVKDRLQDCIECIKGQAAIPAVLFPGSPLQVCSSADAILFLSLISGRNPELLIGQHVIAAPYILESRLEVMPTGYMLVDGGRPTTASYMSNTQPIPSDKEDIAVCTALAGEMLGLKLLYLDGGSGARTPVPASMIRAVREKVSLPLFVGGGLRSPEAAHMAVSAGADLVVVGNVLEKNPGLLTDISSAVHSVKVNA